MAGKVGVGIDIGLASLRIVWLNYSLEHSEVLHAVEYPLPGSDDENFSDENALELKKFLRQNKLKISHAVVGITGEHINIRYLRVPPPCTPARIATVADMDIANMLKESRVSLACDYMPLNPEDLSAKQPGLVAIVMGRNSFLDRVSGFFRRAGIAVRYFVPNSFALYHTFIKFCDVPEREVVCMINGDFGNLDMAICLGNKLRFLRNLSIGSGDVGEDEATMGYNLVKLDLDDIENTAATQVHPAKHTQRIGMPISPQKISQYVESSLRFAEMQTKQKIQIDRLLLCGEGSRNPQVRAALMSSLRSPVFLLEPSPLAKGEFPDAEEKAELFCVALGLSHMHVARDSGGIELISVRRRAKEVLLKRHLFEYISIAALVVFIVVAIAYSFSAESHYQQQAQQFERKYNEYQSRAVEISELVEKNRVLQRKLQYLRRKVSPNKYLLEMLALIHKKIPSSVRLTYLDFSSGEEQPIRMTVKGVIEESYAGVFDLLDEFKSTIKSSPLVEKYHEKDPGSLEDERKLKFHMEIELRAR